MFVLSHGLRVAGWIAACSGGVECSQDVEPGSGVPKFDDGTGGRREASVEGGVDREETVGATPEPPGGTRGIADRVVRVRGATRLVPPSVVVLWGDAGVLACGSGYTPVTVGDGGRHAGASRGAEVVARFEGACVESLDSVSDGDDPRVGDAVGLAGCGRRCCLVDLVVGFGKLGPWAGNG